MATESKEQNFVITPLFRVSYAHVWAPQEAKGSGKKYYAVTAIFDKDADLEPMKKLLAAAKAKKFPGYSGKVKSPIRFGRRGDGVTTEDEFDFEKNPEYEGKYVCVFRSYERPVGVVDAQRQPIIDQAEFYSGCYAVASISAFGYDQEGSKGVSFGLRNVMKIKDGEPLAGSAKAEVDFASVDTSGFGTDNADLFDTDGI